MYRQWLMALAALWISGCAAYTATSGQVALKDDSVVAEVRLSADDRAAIKDYYRKSTVVKSASGSMPLLKGGWLPADAKVEPLPVALERKLTPLPTSHARWIVGGDIILVEKKTRAIVDAIYDVRK